MSARPTLAIQVRYHSPQGTLLRLIDPTSDAALPTLDEAVTRADRAETELARLQRQACPDQGCTIELIDSRRREPRR